MKTNRWIIAPWIATGLMLAMTPIVLGHPGNSHAGFAGGAAHPLTGLDHLLAMVAVGMWAVRMGGGVVWRLPLTFAGVMVLGGWVAQMGMPLPAVEAGIAMSVLVLGLALVVWKQPPVWAALTLVGLFAALHGYAHMSEIEAGRNLAAYVSGFVLTTIALHAVGIAIGLAARRLRGIDTLRWAGLGIAALGLGFCVGIL